MKSEMSLKVVAVVSVFCFWGIARADDSAVRQAGIAEMPVAELEAAEESTQADVMVEKNPPAAESAQADAEVTPGKTSVEQSPPAGMPAQNALAFADHLFLDGDYYRAITEYRRFLFTVRGRAPEAPRAAMAIGEALMRGEKWDAAGRQYDGIATRTQQIALRQQALFAAGRAYLLDARPEMAKPRFRLLVDEETVAPALSQDAAWLLAWGHFDAGELEEAYEVFVRIAQSEGVHAKNAQGVAQALLDKDKLDQKDPMLAGLLSIVPGLGHFYLGRWGVGLTSLTWNGVFLFAMTHAWLTGQWGLALVLTVFELGWYTGGIFGAFAGAMRHNRDAIRNWRDDILLQYGASRELPPTHVFEDRTEKALPGTWFRIGTSF